MKRSYLFLTFVAFLTSACLMSCGEKENHDTPSFVGDYDLTIVTDSLGTDGTWFDTEFYTQMTGKEEPPRYGTMTITETDNPGEYHVTSVVSKDGMNDLKPYFESYGIMDESGNLVLNESHNNNGNGTILIFNYAPLTLGESIVFRTEMHTFFGTLDCGYIMTNTAKKRQ